jgi:hypothetical protein
MSTYALYRTQKRVTFSFTISPTNDVAEAGLFVLQEFANHAALPEEYGCRASIQHLATTAWYGRNVADYEGLAAIECLKFAPSTQRQRLDRFEHGCRHMCGKVGLQALLGETGIGVRFPSCDTHSVAGLKARGPSSSH